MDQHAGHAFMQCKNSEFVHLSASYIGTEISFNFRLITMMNSKLDRLGTDIN